MDLSDQRRRGKRRRPHYEKQLKAAFVKSAPPGRHTDGGGLYLYVSETGARRWVLRITVQGRRRDFGLGPATLVSLADAREIAHRYRIIAQQGGDPSNPIHGLRVEDVMFEDAAREYHAANVVQSSKNGKHVAQWLTTLEKYAFPVIGKRSVRDIAHADIVRVLHPIWLEKKETARRVLQRMGVVLDFCIVKGYRNDANPTAGVRTALPRQKIKVENFAAIDWQQTPELMMMLKKTPGIGAVALRFAILTVLRSGTVRHATWDQFADGFGTWHIPAANMKGDQPHDVPLPAAARNLLLELWDQRNPKTDLVFPSPSNPMKPISENTMTKVIKKFDPSATVHGMRLTQPPDLRPVGC